MVAPPSQKNRPIGFWLEGGSGGEVQLDLLIRPEDMTREEPSRIAEVQTLGGAWVDSFGRGLSTIVLSGTQGWRGGAFLSGEDAFQQLRSTVFQAWHDRRAALVAQGQDPAGVSLYFMDSLNGIRALVAPRMFQLRRSRTSPLLIRYQIRLTVLDDTDAPDDPLDDIVQALSNPLRWLAGVTGLGNVLGQLQYYASEAQAVLGSAISGVGSFLSLGSSIISSVSSTAASLQGQFDSLTTPLLTTGILVCASAANAFTVLGDNPDLPVSQRIPVMALASNFNDAACTMQNGFGSSSSFLSLADLAGASTCSSTAGGDAWNPYVVALANPFESMLGVGSAPPVQVTADAQDALTTLSGDPIPLIGQPATVGLLMARITAGVSVS